MRKDPFWAILVQKIQNGPSKVKLGTNNYSDAQNWMVMLTFSVLDQKCSR